MHIYVHSHIVVQEEWQNGEVIYILIDRRTLWWSQLSSYKLMLFLCFQMYISDKPMKVTKSKFNSPLRWKVISWNPLQKHIMLSTNNGLILMLKVKDIFVWSWKRWANIHNMLRTYVINYKLDFWVPLYSS